MNRSVFLEAMIPTGVVVESINFLSYRRPQFAQAQATKDKYGTNMLMCVCGCIHDVSASMTWLCQEHETQERALRALKLDARRNA